MRPQRRRPARSVVISSLSPLAQVFVEPHESGRTFPHAAAVANRNASLWASHWFDHKTAKPWVDAGCPSPTLALECAAAGITPVMLALPYEHTEFEGALGIHMTVADALWLKQITVARVHTLLIATGVLVDGTEQAEASGDAAGGAR